MSDTSSDGAEPGRLNDTDYPLLPPSSVVDIEAIVREYDRVIRRLLRHSRTSRLAATTRQPRPGISVLPRPAPHPALAEYISNGPSLDSIGGDDATSLPAVTQSATAPVPSAVNRMDQAPKKPVVTFVSALPSTTYKEENDSSSNANTLAYVKVQRALLKHAEKHALDSLSPHQARVWTQTIDPSGNKKPKAADTLRLCYYMRSQGYDVYSQVEASCVHLYLVNQGSYIRDKKHDVLYWKQNFKTNHVDFYAPSSSSRSSRRNVVSDLAFHVVEGMPTRPAVAPATADGGPHEDATANVALRQAQARLQLELSREPGNPDAVNAAIQRIEALQQGDGSGRNDVQEVAPPATVLEEVDGSPAARPPPSLHPNE